MQSKLEAVEKLIKAYKLKINELNGGIILFVENGKCGKFWKI